MTTYSDKVIVLLEAQLRQFRTETANAHQEFNRRIDSMEKNSARAERQIKKNFDGISRSFRGLLAGVSIGALTRAFGGAVNQIAELGEIAGRVDISTRSLQALYRIASQTGASVTDVDKALQSVAEQSQETGSYLQRLFQANDKMISKDGEKNLRTLMNILRDLGSAEARLSALTKITGDRVGRGLVEALSKGEDVVDGTFEAMEKAGKGHSDAQIKHMKEMRDKYRTYMNDIQIKWESVVVGMLETTDLFNTEDMELTRLSTALDNLKKQRDELMANGPGFLESWGLAGSELDFVNKKIEELTPKVQALRELVMSRQSVASEGKGDRQTARLPLSPAELTAKKEREEMEKAIQAIFRATEQEIAALRQEAEAFGKTTYEIARTRKELELMMALEKEHRQNGGVITDEEVARVKMMADAFGQLTTAIEDSATEMEMLQEHTDVIFDNMESALDQFIETGKLSFKGFISSVIKDMARLAVRNTLNFIQNGQPGTANTGLIGLLSGALGIGSVTNKVAPTLGASLVGLPGAVSRNPYDTGAGGAGVGLPPVDMSVQKSTLQAPPTGGVGPGAVGAGGDVSAVEAYIRQAARARGIDENIAVSLAKHEGLQRGTWQSNAITDGIRERSYGPFQMLFDHPGRAGMGDDFHTATGLSPADPANMQAMVDFALDQAATGGWSPWLNTMRKMGIGSRTGLSGARPLGGLSPGATPVASLPAPMPMMTGMAPTGLAGLVGGDWLSSIMSLLPLLQMFGDGGVSNKPAIFGESGAEAAVPLPDGRSIPVMLNEPVNTRSNDGGNMRVEVFASEDLKTRIVRQADRNASRGDTRTLDMARRNLPDTQRRYQQLGTTSA